MNHAINAVAASLPPASGWILQSGGREFGPLTDDELRRFFSSGVVKQGDFLRHAELDLSETASQAAARLQVAPPAASAAPTPEPPVRHLQVSRVESHALRTTLLALVMLALAGVYASLPKPEDGLWASLTGKSWVGDANRLEDSHDWNAARAHAERWIADDASPNAWLYEGRALVQLHLDVEAERAFRQGLALSPNDTVLLSNLAGLQFDRKQYDQSVQTLRRVLELKPGAADAWYSVGRALSEQSRHADALAAYRRAAGANPGDAWAWSEIGHENYRLGRMQEAIEPLEKAIALDPGFQRPRQILEAVRDSLAGRSSSAAIASVAAARPATATASLAGALPPAAAPVTAQPVVPEQAAPAAAQWDYWKTDARALEEKEDWTGLRNFAERWTQAQPQRAAAWSSLGTALRNLRQWDAAIKANLRAAELAPNDTAVLFELGLSYSTNLDYVNAIPVYEHLLSLDPGDDPALNNLAGAYSGVGRIQDSISAYKKSVAINRRNIVAWNNLGKMYYESNRFPESIDAYEQALAMAPENHTAKLGLQRSKQR